MPNSFAIQSLDEPALANDVVRLLGAENQRLKRELQEALQRASDAEARALIKKQEPQDVAAAERVQQLLEENTSLRTQYQDVESKYETEKEKRRGLKAQLKDLKLKGAHSGIDESLEFLELQKRLVQTQCSLDEADAYVKELLRQVQQMARDKEANKNLLDDAKNRIALLTQSDPWAYVSELYNHHGNFGFTKLSPFQVDGEGAREALNTFYGSLSSGRKPLVYRTHDILWNQIMPGNAIAVAPPYRYVPNNTRTAHEWEHNNIRAIDGPFELVYETHGFWYYCGTFTTSIIESRNNAHLFNTLRLQFQKYLIKETVIDPDLLPPIVSKTITELYSQGVLHVVCLVFARTGFNEQLNNALLEFGKDVRGPIYALDVNNRNTKKRIEEGGTAIPPKIKRARIVSAQAGRSKPSNSANF